MENEWRPYPPEALASLSKIKDLVVQHDPGEPVARNFYRSWFASGDISESDDDIVGDDVDPDVMNESLHTASDTEKGVTETESAVLWSEICQMDPNATPSFKEKFRQLLETWDSSHANLLTIPEPKFAFQTVQFLSEHHEPWMSSDRSRLEELLIEVVWADFMDVGQCSKDVFVHLLLVIEAFETAVTQGIVVKNLSKMITHPPNPVQQRNLQSLIEKIRLEPNRLAVLSCFMDVELNDATLAFLERLMFKVGLLRSGLADERTAVGMLNALKTTEAAGSAKSSKIGTFLLTLLKETPSPLSPCLHQAFMSVVESHQSFLKNAALSEIRRRQVT